MRAHSAITALLIALPAFGCVPTEGGLHGSLSDFYDLDHERVRARLYDDTLSIEYVRTDSQVPVRLTLTGPKPGTHDLLDRGDATGRVGHQVLPGLMAGQIVLSAFEATSQERVAGSFDARFEVGDKTASLRGEFDTELEIVGDIEGYDYSSGGAP